MFEIEKKFNIHFNNVKPFMDKVNHLGFELASSQEQRTIYLATKNPVIKVRASRTQVSDIKIKTEYSLIRRYMKNYKTKLNDYKELPFIEEEKISKFVADSMIGTSEKSYLPTITKLRRTFKKKEQPKGLTTDKTHLIIIDFDDVQAVGNDNLFVEFKMMVENISDKSEALKNIDSVLDMLQPFVGEFEGSPYLSIINKMSKTL